MERYLIDPSARDDPYEMFAGLRALDPIHESRTGSWVITRHADVKAVFRDAKRFSSAEGFRGAGVVVGEEESFLGEIDPPLHTRVRRLLVRAFTPQTAAAVEPWTRGRVGAMLDENVAGRN